MDVTEANAKHQIAIAQAFDVYREALVRAEREYYDMCAVADEVFALRTGRKPYA